MCVSCAIWCCDTFPSISEIMNSDQQSSWMFYDNTVFMDYFDPSLNDSVTV